MGQTRNSPYNDASRGPRSWLYIPYVAITRRGTRYSPLPLRPGRRGSSTLARRKESARLYADLTLALTSPGRPRFSNFGAVSTASRRDGDWCPDVSGHRQWTQVLRSRSRTLCVFRLAAFIGRARGGALGHFSRGLVHISSWNTLVDLTPKWLILAARTPPGF